MILAHNAARESKVEILRPPSAGSGWQRRKGV